VWAKQFLRVAARTAAFSGFVTLLEQLGRERPTLLRVLTYHRVDRPDAHPRLWPGLISAIPSEFEQQMAFLAANYHVVSMEEVLDAIRTRSGLPARSVLITFDDAYRDFAQNAWPIMKQYRLPVTLFVPTAYPDQPTRTYWWDRLHNAVTLAAGPDKLHTPLGCLSLATAAQRIQSFNSLKDYLKTLPHDGAMAHVDQICEASKAPGAGHSVLSWHELRELSREGVTMGAHTQTHPILNCVLPEVAETEITGSLSDLHREIGPVPPVFAYPSGGFNDQTIKILEQAGVFLAVTTLGGVNDLQCADLFRIRRVNVSTYTTHQIFRAKLLACTTCLNRWQKMAYR